MNDETFKEANLKHQAAVASLHQVDEVIEQELGWDQPVKLFVVRLIELPTSQGHGFLAEFQQFALPESLRDMHPTIFLSVLGGFFQIEPTASLLTSGNDFYGWLLVHEGWMNLCGHDEKAEVRILALSTRDGRVGLFRERSGITHEVSTYQLNPPSQLTASGAVWDALDELVKATLAVQN